MVQYQLDRVEQSARQAADNGAVDADVLQVVPCVLLDQPHRALWPQRQDAVLDEPGDALVMALDDLENARLGPAVELPAQLLVGDQRAPGPLEPLEIGRAHV